jgi:polyketide synthase-associated protein
MPPALALGQLVQIEGLKEAVPSADGYGDGPVEASGQMGQVTEWDEATGKWTVATFAANMVSLEEKCLRPLITADVEDFDVALGPASDVNVLGAELADNLARKGSALCKLFVAPGDLTEMVTTAEKLAEDGQFQRLAGEVEPAYLGKECTGKTLTVDFDDPAADESLRNSSLKILDSAISTVGTMLQPFTMDQFGFEVYSCSKAMVSMPFLGDEDSYQVPDLGNEDAASFLYMMRRAKVMVIANCGPGDAVLELIPKKDGDSAAPLTVKPGMLAMFSVPRFAFTYKPVGKAVSMAAFLLDAPKEFVVNDLDGDFSHVSGANKGPKAPKNNQVTVKGMAERYAFGVDEPWKLWMGYAKAGFDTQIRHPFTRWDCDLYYAEDADQTSGLSYTCHGGFSDGIELFDCKFFDISPAEARGMDPTQRQVLEVSFVALINAGYVKKQLQSKSSNTAWFVGLDKNEWNSIPKDIAGGFGASSSANAITANRFNYCLNLKGASMTIDTACSASLVCTHTAKLYLLYKHYDPCEGAGVTGVNLSLSPMTYIGACGAGMHSHIGRCFTYNFSADGYARGEATASICMKLVDFDAKAGDYALCAGSHVNQDGRSASLTAPNGPSQERCNSAVLKEIGIMPREVDTTECHGTGTSLGDPIEIGAYRKIMAADPRDEPVSITSSKSNLGHCEGSAGVSGFTKCVLMCLYGEGTPNCHLSCLNPHLDMDGFPGVITSEGITFKHDTSYNGVLSFGFGGTNACAEVYGPNQMTSRACGAKDVYALVVKQLTMSEAPEVTITGDNWEEWEMEGPGMDAKPGDVWDVEFDDDGTISWSKQDNDPPDLGNYYDITGTFNEWGYDSMEADESIPGLYTFTLDIGAKGEEDFQIVADQDPTQTIFPDMTKCTVKSCPILGPSDAKKDNSWCVRGRDGDKFRVEFFKSDAGCLSVSWFLEGRTASE